MKERLVVVSNRGPARILIHQGAAGHWLRIRLTQPGANRFGVGAHVRVEAQGRTCMQAVGAGTSYLSHRPLELTFGLGTAEKADRIVVTWPDGKTTTLTDTAGDQALTIRQVDDGK